MVFIYDNFIYLFVSCLIKLHPIHREKCCTCNIASSTTPLGGIRTHNVSGDSIGSCKCNYMYDHDGDDPPFASCSQVMHKMHIRIMCNIFLCVLDGV
jgi:hypothetical protein